MDLLNILLLEDSESDAHQVETTLSAGGLKFSLTRLEGAAAYRACLEKDKPSLIISDYHLPAFSCEEALSIRNEVLPSVPFIVLTGVLDDRTASELVKLGADDYLLKDRLARLPSAVVSALAKKTAETAEKNLRMQLEHAQKLDALGSFSAGIVHDFNNILSVIDGYISLVLPGLEPSPLREDILEIREVGRRGTRIARQLLSFSRKQTMQLECLDLRDIAAGASGLMTKILGPEIRLLQEDGGEPAIVSCDRTRIEQVLLNLVANARDAMPAGGRLLIRSGKTVFNSEPQQGAKLSRGEHCAYLAVSDTGKGIPPGDIPSLFTPFFTTKPVSGTGLGPSTSRDIINGHGGSMTLESAPGAGTTVSFFLPLAREVPALNPPSGAAAAPGDGGGISVLLIEDDRHLREIAARFLTSRNFRVMTAEGLEEGFARLKETKDRTEVIFADIRLPDGNAPREADRFRKLAPGCKFLFTTGYLDKSGPCAGTPPADCQFINKPYAMERICELLIRLARSKPEGQAGS